MNQSIAIYREQRFDGKRIFELFADRVHVIGSVQLSSDFDTTVLLASLNPEPTRLRLRNKAFWAGAWMLLGAIVLNAILASALFVSYASVPFLLVAGIGVGGCGVMLATAKKIEFAAFQSHAGLTVLDIAKSGPDAKQFDSFVQLVAKSIQSAASVA